MAYRITDPARIALVGFRGVGKSSVGRMLAAELGHAFLDTDEELVRRFHRDIRSWVEAHGWEAFRLEETGLLESLAHHARLVVATGGGIVLAPSNRQVLKSAFFTVWLQASPGTIMERLRHDPKSFSQRPALTDLPPAEEIVELLSQRSSLYAEVSRLTISTDILSPTAILAAIRSHIESPPSSGID